MFHFKEGSFVEKSEFLKEYFFLADPYDQLLAIGKNSPYHYQGPYEKDQLVIGCQSEVWLKAELKNNRVIYLAYSSSYLVNSLVQAVCYLYSAQEPNQLLSLDWSLEIFPKNLLSSNRVFGLQSMKKKMLLEGLRYAQKT